MTFGLGTELLLVRRTSVDASNLRHLYRISSHQEKCITGGIDCDYLRSQHSRGIKLREAEIARQKANIIAIIASTLVRQ
jgi:hypothetical protein